MHDNFPPTDTRLDEVLTAIVRRFIELIGAPAALSAARKVAGLRVADDGVVLDYDRSEAIGNVTRLLEQYRTAFGETAVNVAYRAAQPVAKERTAALLIDAGFEPPPGSFIVSLLLVDDHVLFRDGLVSLIAPQPDFQVVGQASTVREAIGLAQKLHPDIVLMDFTLPDGNGLEATQAILADRPETKIVFLTIHDDDVTLFKAIRAGAAGFVFKNTRASELLKRLREVARGEAGISPAIARRILEEFARTPASPAQLNTAQAGGLTVREAEIVREIMCGASNREIAARLVISENTVKNHVRNVLTKLQLRNRREIGEYGRRRGLTPPPDSAG
jgi:two-component system nitrate/nitrite response regulator NarL